MALAFAIEGTSPLSQPSTYNASNYSIALTAATSCYLDSLIMQHTPTQRYQDSSDCEKRGCLLVTVIQFTRLPSDSLCHGKPCAIKGPLRSKFPCPCLFLEANAPHTPSNYSIALTAAVLLPRLSGKATSSNPPVKRLE
jgi:hypothetical protein